LIPTFGTSPVDRDAGRRTSAEALEAAWGQAQVLVVDDAGKALVDGTDLVLLPAADSPEGDRLYLGAHEGGHFFAVPGELPRRLGTRAMGLREVGTVLPARDAALLVHAVGLVNWHRAHPCCARCGAPTRVAEGGSLRVCDADGSQHFPRTDPAVIVLVTDGADRCVLGRQSAWPSGVYSTLAGFVEPGESAEQAVVREVREESGVTCRDVTYRASQPWPFPSSLMLGFRAVCDADAEASVQDGELEDCRWFTRDEVRGLGFTRPPLLSIAQSLLAEWLSET